MRSDAIFLLLAGVLFATPALSCSPAPLEVGERTRTPECADVYSDDEYTSRGLGDATDLGGGFVAQFYIDGNACYATATMIVADCNAGRAAIFGPSATQSPMLEGDAEAEAENRPFASLREAVESAAGAGRPMSVEAIAKRADGKFGNAAVVDIRGRIGLSNTDARPRHNFDLSCGCGLFYPGSAGAGE